jgi:hypothetical protein
MSRTLIALGLACLLAAARAQAPPPGQGPAGALEPTVTPSPEISTTVRSTPAAQALILPSTPPAPPPQESAVSPAGGGPGGGAAGPAPPPSAPVPPTVPGKRNCWDRFRAWGVNKSIKAP